MKYGLIELHDNYDFSTPIACKELVRCEDCRKSHIDGKTTHHLWCTEWGRSTDVFGYCERGEREGERWAIVYAESANSINTSH